MHKAILLSPPKYSLAKSLTEILTHLGMSVTLMNYRDCLNQFDQKVNVQIYRFPYKIRNAWDIKYAKKINNWYLSEFSTINPDLVFVYNNEMLHPETMQWLKDRKVKIAFFLGDIPLYSLTSIHNLTILDYADAIFVPDSFWMKQLKKIGLANVNHILLPLPTDEYYPLQNDSAKKDKFTEVFYQGMSYKNSWGYKKAKFLNFFTEFNLKIIGNSSWNRWFRYFPELKKSFELQKYYITVDSLNRMYNYAKIVPVDGNPGIFNGIHARAIEALSAGTLPLMEYYEDMDFIFEGVPDLPFVKDYRQIPEVANYYLNNESERQNRIQKMKAVYESKYNLESVSEFIMHHILS